MNEIEILQERPAVREGGREVELAESRENLKGLCLHGQGVCGASGRRGKYVYNICTGCVCECVCVCVCVCVHISIQVQYIVHVHE